MTAVCGPNAIVTYFCHLNRQVGVHTVMFILMLSLDLSAICFAKSYPVTIYLEMAIRSLFRFDHPDLYFNWRGFLRQSWFAP